MRNTIAKLWMLIIPIAALLLQSCHFHPIYESSGYTLAVYRDPAWKADPLHPEIEPVVYLMSMGEDSQNSWTSLPSMPRVFVADICDIPGEQRKALVKIDNTVLHDVPAAPIRYLVISREHPSKLDSAEEVRKVESDLGRATLSNWKDVSDIIEGLIAAKYPYAGKVQPGEYVEVPNLFTW